MRKNMLKQSMYDRWLEYGTIYGITDYSFIGITKEDEYLSASVIKPFWIEYLYMVSIVIAQKECIGMFSEKAGSVASGLSKMRFQALRIRDIGKINELNRTYIECINRVCLVKFSNQQQGKEMYDILQKQLKVYESKKYFEDELKGLCQISETSIKIKRELGGILLKVVGFVGITEIGIKTIKYIGELMCEFFSKYL